MFRSTGDIQDNWECIKRLALSQMGNQCYGAPYCHNDIDMLVVGMHGGSNNEFINGGSHDQFANKDGKGIGGCTDTEYKTHFSLWAMMNSPLMIGCDVRRMTDRTKEILTNKDVLALNQDIECRSPYRISQWNNPENVFSLVKPLSNGDFAIGMFNFSDVNAEMSLQLWDIGLSAAAGRGLQVYDCWEHKDDGCYSERLVKTVAPHDCLVFRAKVVKL